MNDQAYLIQAISNLYKLPDGRTGAWSNIDNTYAGCVGQEPGVPWPTQAEVEAEVARLAAIANRRLVPKSLIIKRLFEAGKLTAAMAVLDEPENLYARERWRAPDWPNVYFDDPELVAVLTTIGADVEEITAPGSP